MPFDSWKHHRRSTRLKGYDYTQEGAYVVTICTFQRECTLAEVNADGVALINACGEIVCDEWLKTPQIRPYIDLDAFIVMPNHFHGIILITESQTAGDVSAQSATVGAQRAAPLQSPTSNTFAKVPKGSLGAIVRSFKAAVTMRINALRDTPQAPVWQRSFYDNIIVNEKMLNQFRIYIDNNPSKWAEDRYHP